MLGLSLITIIIYGFFGSWPAVKSALISKSNLQTGGEIEHLLGQKILNLKTAGNNITTHQAEIKILSESLPSEENYGKLIEDLTKIASAYNIRIEFYQRGGESEDKLNLVTPMWLGLSGEYTNLTNYLVAIESTTRQLRVTSVSLNPVKESGTQVKASVLLNAYLVKTGST